MRTRRNLTASRAKTRSRCAWCPLTRLAGCRDFPCIYPRVVLQLCEGENSASSCRLSTIRTCKMDEKISWLCLSCQKSGNLAKSVLIIFSIFLCCCILFPGFLYFYFVFLCSIPVRTVYLLCLVLCSSFSFLISSLWHEF